MDYIGIFPGQGSQKIGMGKDFYDSSKLAREMFEKASERLNLDFQTLLFEQNDKLELTQFTQPAILLVSVIAYKLFKSQIQNNPKYLLGHSLGEFSAQCATNSLDYLDALELVYNRGLLMSDACEGKEAGMMALLGLSDEKTESLVKEAQNNKKKIWVANYNCDGQIVLAGDKSDLASMESYFKENGAKRAILLNMSVASHCPILKEAQPKLNGYLKDFIKDNFEIPVISNVLAKEYNTKDQAIDLLTNQLVKPVLYKQSISSIDGKCGVFIEFGGSVLKGINRKITKVPTKSITDMSSLESVVSEFK
jgi:[acyl-carrier-protein] S-malonyltransferase